MSKLDVLNPHSEYISSNETIEDNRNFHVISLHDFFELINYKREILIVDLRNSDSFLKGHIVKSKHVNCSTNIMTKMSIMKLKKEINSSGNLPSKTIIMYNQSNNNYNQFLLEFIETLNFNIHALFLEGGFQGFAKSAPSEYIESTANIILCSPTNPDLASEDIMNASISQIEPHLFLGNYFDSANLQLLQSIGITQILCVTSSTKLYFEELNVFEYKRINADDSCKQNLFEFFDESFQFIEKARKKNGKVLVHCMAGVSRSVTIVLSYLIRRYKMKVFDALDVVREKRSVASPNLNFLGQLERFYREYVA